MRRDRDQTHKLDPYKGIIKARLEEFPSLSAQRPFDEVRVARYEGSYGRVRDHMRSVRPRQPVVAAIRFETPPRSLSDWSRFAVKCGQHTSPLARFTRNFREYRVLVSPIGCDFPAYGLLAA